MKGRIAVRLLMFFALALLLFALVSSLLFGRLFTTWVMDSKRTEMLEQGQALSRTLSDLLSSQAAPARGAGGRGMMGEGGISFTAYVRQLTQTRQDLWVLDENLKVLSSGRMMGRTLTYDSIPPDAGSLVKAVFDKQTPFSQGFSDLMGVPTLTLGVPIYQGNQVAGALLLHDTVAGIEAASRQGQRILLISAALAMGLSILLSLGLSLSFTRPIARLERTAMLLSLGDYSARTGIAGSDEIARLAGSMDVLGQRLQEARTKEEQQEQQRRDFLASVSHELRTPLTVMRGSLEALLDEVVKEPGQVRAYHAQMLAETGSMQRLVNDLLELARLQNAAFQIQMEELDLQQVFSDAVRSADLLAKEKNIQLVCDSAGKKILLEGDYGRLKQMMLIVLDNAIKFSPQGGLVSVSLSPGRLTVIDQGPGIPEAELPHLFERFRTARQQDSRSGSGLGLAIARQIALRHGMKIAVENRTEGGTQVSYTWQTANS